VTAPSVPYRIPDPAQPPGGPQIAPGQAPELPPGLCTRCGAVGTHYLTYPSLRLPSVTASTRMMTPRPGVRNAASAIAASDEAAG
jgi:hypothetical protein